MTDTDLNLRDLIETPFELLMELERRAVERQTGRLDAPSEWVGVGLRLGEGRYVVPRSEIREVLQNPPLTRVPGANPWLLGLANVRGQLIPIVDLKVLCGAPASNPDRLTRVILVNNEEVPMGVLVDEVFGFRRFMADDRNDDGGDDEELGGFIDGVFRREGHIWPVLSFFKVIESDRLLSAT